MADRIRIIPHSPAGILYCGSFEVRFPDGRESIYFYWDELEMVNGWVKPILGF